MSDNNQAPEKRVRHFRQILLWPLQLMPIRKGAQVQKHWEVLEQEREDNPWHEVLDEFTGDPTEFKQRHYNEFVTFWTVATRDGGRSRCLRSNSALASLK